MRQNLAIVSPRARRDLRRLAEWLREEVEPDVAERVIVAARRSFDILAETPGLGAPAEAKSAKSFRARRWRIQGFSNYLIFYEPRSPNGVTILRVLHAAQDWKRR